MRYLTLLLLLPLSALATDYRPPFQRQDQGQQQTANGGTASSQAVGGNVGNISTENNTFALWGNITQVQVSDCIVPAKGRGRSQNWFWGVFSISGYSEISEECVSAKLQILAAEARLIEAQNEAERLRQENERLRSEVSTCRAREVCGSLK